MNSLITLKSPINVSRLNIKLTKDKAQNCCCHITIIKFEIFFEINKNPNIEKLCNKKASAPFQSHEKV